MTREEAIELLTHMMIAYVPKDRYGDYNDPEPYEQAIDMAIEALSAESNCKDCKKRNNTTFFMDDEETIDIVIEALSVEPSEHICKECQFYPIYCQTGAPDGHWEACEGFVLKDELAEMKGGTE